MGARRECTMKLFRVANEASIARHVAVTTVQIVLFWTTFLVLLPWLVVSLERVAALPPLGLANARTIGAVVFSLASLLGLASGMTMAVTGRGTPLPCATARDLVHSGPYRVLRNPMALAGIVQGLGVGLWLDSTAVVLYALAGAVGWHVLVRPAEERDLAARFGAAYLAYRDRFPLWLPRLRAPWERLLGRALLAFAIALLVVRPPRSLEAAYRLAPVVTIAVLLGAVLVRRATTPRTARDPATAL